MALRLVSDFDLRKDVLPWLRAQRVVSAAAGSRGGGPGVLENNYESLRILNVERNGNVIYTYKDDKGNVFFGLYDCQTRQNEHLYTFEKDLHVVSCSVNSDRTLLAASLVHSTKEGRKNELQPELNKEVPAVGQALCLMLGMQCYAREVWQLPTCKTLKPWKASSFLVDTRADVSRILIQSASYHTMKAHGSKCLTLLVEIHPVNNVKVLKAVDSYIWVQFLYPHVESHPLPENHLLLVSEEKYIEKFHIQVIQEDGSRVDVKNNPEDN